MCRIEFKETYKNNDNTFERTCNQMIFFKSFFSFNKAEAEDKFFKEFFSFFVLIYLTTGIMLSF